MAAGALIGLARKPPWKAASCAELGRFCLNAPPVSVLRFDHLAARTIERDDLAGQLQGARSLVEQLKERALWSEGCPGSCNLQCEVAEAAQEEVCTSQQIESSLGERLSRTTEELLG